MQNNFYPPELSYWSRKRTSAKRRMVTGIVFSAIAYFLEMVGVGVYYATFDDEMMLIVAAVIILLSVPFWAAGLPLLITGIVRLIKAKRQISRICAAPRNSAPQYPNYQQPNYGQPVNPQPNYQQPNYQQPSYQQPNYQQPNSQQQSYGQPIYQPPMYQQPEQQPTQQPTDTNQGSDNTL